MSIKKKHGYAECLKYMRMIKAGKPISYIHEKYGIGHERLNVLWARYQSEGPSGLLRRKNFNADYALKRKIILDIETLLSRKSGLIAL